MFSKRQGQETQTMATGMFQNKRGQICMHDPKLDFKKKRNYKDWHN